MCYPVAQPRVSKVEVKTRFSKSWSPFQIVRSINTKIVNNGLHFSRKVVRVTGKAKSKVVSVQKWVFNLTFAKIIIPLAFFSFLLLLHPHTEIQVGAVTTFSILLILFLLISSTSKKCHNEDDLSSTDPTSQLTPETVIPQSQYALALYSLLPLASISRGWGWLASRQFPTPIRILIIWIFALATGCDRSESEHELSEYKSLSDFFTRRLRPGVRPISDSHCLVSPADGSITASSTLHNFTHMIKGLAYSLDLFLGSLEDVTSIIRQDILPDGDEVYSVPPEQIPAPLKFHNHSHLYQTTIYLSPGDYHRFHSPADWTVFMRRHMPGTMYSVSPSIVKMIPTCIVTNERVAWFGRWKYGTFIMVAVAATNVGDIQTHFDADISTNNIENRVESEKVYDKPLNFSRGDDFGHFNFGSTIVLIYEAPQPINFGSNPTKRVKMGEGLYI